MCHKSRRGLLSSKHPPLHHPEFSRLTKGSIVAVHGLQEDLVSAWTDPRTSILWLRDLLPEDVKNVRVLTFGYNGSPESFFGHGGVDPLYPTAETLVATLHTDRSLTHCLQRPIIFVCHGLGGLLVKQALLYAHDQRGKHTRFYRDIYTCTYAIVFFGTPHDQVDRNVWLQPKRLLKSSDSFQYGPRDALTNVNRAFRGLQNDLNMLFLWEEIETHVKESSAAPALDVQRSGIPADHINMTKFSSRSSPGYRTVLAPLLGFIQDAPLKIALKWQEQENQGAMQRYELAKIDSQSKSPTTGQSGKGVGGDTPVFSQKRISSTFDPPLDELLQTSTFVGREKEFKKLENAIFSSSQPPGPKIFVIYGMGGSGKTELCSRFATKHKNRFQGVLTVKASSQDQIKRTYADIGTKGGLEATENAAKHILSHLSYPFLLVIDNADDPALDLPKLFPKKNNYAYIVITTRNLDLCEVATVGSMELKGLEETEALELLLSRADIPKPVDDATRSLANEICKTLGFLPLALVVAGTYIKRGKFSSRLQDYLDFYNACRKSYKPSRVKMDSADMGEDRKLKTAYPTFEVSLAYLEEQNSTACQDAIEILNVVGFYHFERIGVDMFTTAVKNRSQSFGRRPRPSLVANLLSPIHRRLQPPVLLPGFLKTRAAVLEAYRAEDAIAELASLSLIRWDGSARTFSLHPLVHAWAQDRLRECRQIYAQMAFNLLAEAITLPSDDLGKDDLGVRQSREIFHRSLLPHLDACLAACPVEIGPYKTYLSKVSLSLTRCLLPTALSILMQQSLAAAKSGYVYAECGKFQQSVDYLTKVKDLLHELLGPRHKSTMTIMLGLAKVYWGLGRLDEAIELQKLVVDARKQVLGETHIDTLLAMDDLGRSHWLNGQYKEALELSGSSMRQMKLELGLNDDRTLAAMDNYGVALASWHRFSESAAIHKEVFTIREEKLGPKHLDTLTSKNNLAMAFLELKHLDEAQELMTGVFEERKRQLGKEHPWTLWALCWLAKIKVKIGKLDEAEELLDGGIEAGIRSLDKNHLGVLMGNGELARVYSRQGRLNKAFEVLSDTVTRLGKSRGIEHPDCFYALWKLSVLHHRLGRAREARDACETALKRARKRLTDAHPLVGMIAADLEGFQKSLRPQAQRETGGQEAAADGLPDTKTGVSTLNRRFWPRRAQLTW
ncbi:tetratricopeptide repeat domain protein [Fonsecaea pedrosoi]|nr:tetratricopeptide repeat domain protein [Fonsecaea pedrosoi]